MDLKKIKITKQAKICLSLLIAIIMLLFIIIILYNDKFYPNTSIGGIDVSNMTLSEAKNAVQTDLKNHVLVIKGRNNAKYELRGADIDLNANYEKQVEDCFKRDSGECRSRVRMTGSGIESCPLCFTNIVVCFS